MNRMNQDFIKEVHFRTARSGGKGGQNVNKVESMVEGIWQVVESLYFTNEQKQMIQLRLAHRINAEGFLRVRSSEQRSQMANKEIVITKMTEMIRLALQTPRKRHKTKLPGYAKEARLNNKKRQALKKGERSTRLLND